MIFLCGRGVQQRQVYFPPPIVARQASRTLRPLHKAKRFIPTTTKEPDMRKRVIAAAIGLMTLAVSVSACSSWMGGSGSGSGSSSSSSSSSSSM